MTESSAEGMLTGHQWPSIAHICGASSYREIGTNFFASFPIKRSPQVPRSTPLHYCISRWIRTSEIFEFEARSDGVGRSSDLTPERGLVEFPIPVDKTPRKPLAAPTFQWKYSSARKVTIRSKIVLLGDPDGDIRCYNLNTSEESTPCVFKTALGYWLRNQYRD